MAYLSRGVIVASAITVLAGTPTLAEGGDDPIAAPSASAPAAQSAVEAPVAAAQTPDGSQAGDTSTTTSPPTTTDLPVTDSTTATASDTTVPDTTVAVTDESEPPSSTTPSGSSTTIAGVDQSPTGSSTAPSGTGTSGTGATVHNTGDADSSGTAPTSDNSSEQSVEITSIQVSVADTGGNNSSSQTSGTGSSSSTSAVSAQVTTGSASALGSSDSTALVQQAATQLTGNATADIVQISIVFNIGGAAATTGNNSLSAGGSAGSGGSNGSITSGSAVAIGNESAVYATQGASASAGAGTSDSSRQNTLLLNIGVAVSNTGGNTIVATLSGAGSAVAATGAATAIGNQSTTRVTQLATGTVANGGDLTIEQRAAIVNLGLALADSGSNTIGAALTTAIRTGESADFERLLAAIVPELLKTAAPVPTAGPGAAPSGSAVTGDATAIGNRSSTVVQQVAVGAATGGSVYVGQDIVIVNAGVASATTGGNAIGGSVATLDVDAQAVVAQLAAFLSGLLDQIDAWSRGDSSELGGGRLSTTLGGVTIDLDSSIAANVTTAGAGSSATIRQLSAVINLAFALASSGGNVTNTLIATTVTPPATGESSSRVSASSAGAPNGASVVIVTGNASATNANLVVVCQLRNTADVQCLGPETHEQEPPPSLPEQPAPQPESPVDASLPSEPVSGIMDIPSEAPADPPALAPRAAAPLAATGGRPFPTLAIATAAVLAGSLMLLARRRPRSACQADYQAVDGR